jgi:DNA ligase-1
VLFDVLHLDGRDTFDLPQRERFALLRREAPGLTVAHLVTDDVEKADGIPRRRVRARARGRDGEGAGAPYEAGGRGASWLKVKTAHTLDLVVLAAEWGNGRRRAGCRTSTSARAIRDRRVRHARQDVQGHDRRAARVADARVRGSRQQARGQHVYLPPEFVVEIAFDDIQASPAIPAGWRCGSRGSSATGRTRRRPRRTRSTPCGPSSRADREEAGT